MSISKLHIFLGDFQKASIPIFYKRAKTTFLQKKLFVFLAFQLFFWGYHISHFHRPIFYISPDEIRSSRRVQKSEGSRAWRIEMSQFGINWGPNWSVVPWALWLAMQTRRFSLLRACSGWSLSRNNVIWARNSLMTLFVLARTHSQNVFSPGALSHCMARASNRSQIINARRLEARLIKTPPAAARGIYGILDPSRRKS